MGKPQNIRSSTKREQEKNLKRKKNKNRGIYESQQHKFILKSLPGLPQKKYGLVKVDFTPVQVVTGVFEESIPIYNQDKKYWTDAFIPKNKKDYYFANPSLEKIKFQEKKKQKILQSSMNTPKHPPNKVPEATHNYCQICKCSFDDYYAHIYQQEHINKMRSTTAYTFITELINNHRHQKAEKTIVGNQINEYDDLPATGKAHYKKKNIQKATRKKPKKIKL